MLTSIKENSMQSQQERLKEMVEYLVSKVGPENPLVRELQRQIVSGQPRPHSPNPMGEDRYLAGFKKAAGSLSNPQS